MKKRRKKTCDQMLMGYSCIAFPSTLHRIIIQDKMKNTKKCVRPSVFLFSSFFFIFFLRVSCLRLFIWFIWMIFNSERESMTSSSCLDIYERPAHPRRLTMTILNMCSRWNTLCVSFVRCPSRFSLRSYIASSYSFVCAQASS